MQPQVTIFLSYLHLFQENPILLHQPNELCNIRALQFSNGIKLRFRFLQSVELRG